MVLQNDLAVSENRAGGRRRLSQAVMTASKINPDASSLDEPPALQRPFSLGLVSCGPSAVVLPHPWAFARSEVTCAWRSLWSQQPKSTQVPFFGHSAPSWCLVLRRWSMPQRAGQCRWVSAPSCAGSCCPACCLLPGLSRGRQELSWKRGRGRAESDGAEDSDGTGMAKPGLLGVRDEDSGAACPKALGYAPKPCCSSLLWYFGFFPEEQLTLPSKLQP